VGDTTDQFVAEIVTLLRDPAAADAIGHEARKFVLAYHSPRAYAERFEAIVGAAARRPASGATMREEPAGQARPTCGRLTFENDRRLL
jgi:hypothetical protein